MTHFSLTKSRFLVAGLYCVPLQALPRDNLNIYHDAIITSFDWYKLVERTLERPDIYIYIYTLVFKKVDTSKIYIFCFFRRNKRKNKRYIYLYTFLKCQPFCKRVYIYISVELTLQNNFFDCRYIDVFD